jgi:hypothetical protein
MERKKIGRPPKPGGPRKRLTFELPISLIAALDAYAEQHGMHKVDFIGEVLADRLGVPYTTQEGLPLNKAS